MRDCLRGIDFERIPDDNGLYGDVAEVFGELVYQPEAGASARQVSALS